MDLRRFRRAPFDRPVLFAPKGDDVFSDGVAVDISIGGMFIATEFVAAFGADILVHITLDRPAADLVLPAIVRWTRPDGMGVQFGLLGARETHEITEIVRRHEENTSDRH